MNDPYPRTQPNIIGNFTHARCIICPQTMALRPPGRRL